MLAPDLVPYSPAHAVARGDMIEVPIWDGPDTRQVIGSAKLDKSKVPVDSIGFVFGLAYTKQADGAIDIVGLSLVAAPALRA